MPAACCAYSIDSSTAGRFGLVVAAVALLCCSWPAGSRWGSRLSPSFFSPVRTIGWKGAISFRECQPAGDRSDLLSDRHRGSAAADGGFCPVAGLGRPISLDRRNLARRPIAIWNTALVAWIWTLARLRSGQNPRRDWAGLTPRSGTRRLWPGSNRLAWDLGLVYLHPLVALAFWIANWRSIGPPGSACIAGCSPCCPWPWPGCGGIWPMRPPLPGSDALTARITAHAGADILSGVSNHLLVATHTFLEMLHYGVWLVAIPLVSVRTLPWRIAEVPLARRSRGLASGDRRSAGHRRTGGDRLLGRLFGRLSPHAATFISRSPCSTCWPKFPFCCGCSKSYPAHDPRRAVAIPADRISGHRAGRAAGLAGSAFRAAIRWRTRVGGLVADGLHLSDRGVGAAAGVARVAPRWRFLAIAETFAPLAECCCFGSPGEARFPIAAPSARDMAAIVAANLASFLLGELLW